MKTLKMMMIVLGLTVVAACQPTNTTNTTSSTQTNSTEQESATVTVSLLVQGVPVEGSEKVVNITEGDSVMKIMQENYKIVEDKGLIVSINDIEMDKGENAGRYWKLLINNTMSEVGANDAKVKADDVITFDLTSDWSY